MSRSMEERVEALMKDDRSTAYGVHMYDDCHGEWDIYQEDSDKNTIEMCRGGWTPTQIAEFIFIKILNVKDSDLLVTDDGRTWLGGRVVSNHEHKDVQTIQIRDGIDNLTLIIIQW